MDHHEWQDWSEEHGDADTADLPDHDNLGTGDLSGGHDLAGQHDLPGDFDDYPADHDAFDAGQPYLHADPGPDLLHDSLGGEQGDAEHGDSDPVGDWQPHEPDGLPEADGHDDPTPLEADHLAFGDPDLTADPDPGWHPTDFPPPLDLGHPAPEPMDGYPWSDPDTLGTGYGDSAGLDHDGLDHDAYADRAATPEDLFAYSGMEQPAGDNPWSALLVSEDPATSSLARWWGAAA
jgi:hypothetical protein